MPSRMVGGGDSQGCGMLMRLGSGQVVGLCICGRGGGGGGGGGVCGWGGGGGGRHGVAKHCGLC